MSDDLLGTVRVLIQVGGEPKVIGYGTWLVSDPQADAAAALAAWDKARDQAEKTLRLYGAEGLARAILAERSDEVASTALPSPEEGL